MGDFTITASPMLAATGQQIVVTIIADPNFKETVNLSIETINNAVVTISPTSIYFCPNDGKTATMEVVEVSAAMDRVIVSALSSASLIRHEVEVDLLP